MIRVKNKPVLIAYEDLGTEAIRRLEVRDFPVIVVMDAEGNDLYETAVLRYILKPVRLQNNISRLYSMCGNFLCNQKSRQCGNLYMRIPV